MNTPSPSDLEHPGYGKEYRSGKRCVDCGEAAGTKWTPYWCPKCDIKRKDRITHSLENTLKTLEEQ